MVTQQRNLIFIYIGEGNWHRFDFDKLEAAGLESIARELQALANRQEVASQDKTRKEREFRYAAVLRLNK